MTKAQLAGGLVTAGSAGLRFLILSPVVTAQPSTLNSRYFMSFSLASLLWFCCATAVIAITIARHGHERLRPLEIRIGLWPIWPVTIIGWVLRCLGLRVRK
jgi:hypothetical protein